jgi:2-hydroxychromene-2-carboxylate isomerase
MCYSTLSASIAEMLSMPMILPQPDPIVQNYETREIPEYQPCIWHLTRLGQAAAEAGKSLDFYCEVSRTIYTVPGWNEGDRLAQAAARAGLDFATLDAKVAADAKRLDEVIEANQNALHAGGHWGVPTMVFEGVPFFGQDRIDVLLWRMKQRGVELRAGGTALPDKFSAVAA